jgi:hypothetical protein
VPSTSQNRDAVHISDRLGSFQARGILGTWEQHIERKQSEGVWAETQNKQQIQNLDRNFGGVLIFKGSVCKVELI